MLKRLIYYIKLANCSSKLSIKRQMEYPAFLISWLIKIPVQYFSGIWMLKVITDKFQNINGWDFKELAFIYGLSLLSNGLMVIIFTQTRYMDSMIIKGEFDRMILRPADIFFQFVTYSINFIGLIDLIPGIIIFIYACDNIHFVWNGINFIKLFGVIVGGTMIRGAFYIIMGSIAFWTKKNSSLISTGITMLERTTMYPLSIYPFFIQILFTVVLPFGFISFYPACEFLGQEDRFLVPVGLSVWTPLIGCVCFFVAICIFRNGLKIYESSGS